MSLRRRVARLERAPTELPLVEWGNLVCGPANVRPDRSGIDWAALYSRADRGDCPIAARLRAIDALPEADPEPGDADAEPAPADEPPSGQG